MIPGVLESTARPIQSPATGGEHRVLGRGVEDQRAEPLDRGDRVDALPEEVARIHLGTDVRRVGRLDVMRRR